MTTRMLAVLWDRFVASDPGLTRLASAARVTVSVAVVVAVLVFAATKLGLPVSVALLGAVVAMQTALSVNDASPRATTLMVPLPASAGIVLGALVSSQWILSDVVFLAILFTAVAIRRYGQRWTVLGTIATLSYFIALFLGATIDQVPALIVAAAVAVALTYVVKFVVLRDPPGWTARRVVEGYRARLRLVLDASLDVLVAGDEGARGRLDSATLCLNETARALEARLADDAGAIARAVFDAELAAENVASAAVRARDADPKPPRALTLALRALRHRRIERATRLASTIRDASDAPPAERELAAAIVDLGVAAHGLEGIDDAVAASAGSAPPVPPPQQPPLRQAVQVTIAAAAAIVVGELLSPLRWYWAVLATYFVFIGTASAGETLVRAWSRTIGTALGVVLGLLVGHLAAGHPVIEVVAMFACLFLGIYALRVSYAVMIFFITALLALTWGMLGKLSDGLLAVRLAETAIGAAFGALAATLILPTRTRDVIRDALHDSLDAVADVVHASIEHLIDPQGDVHPIAAARDLDKRFNDFLDRARPIVSGAALARRSSELRRWIVTLSAADYYARGLAGLAEDAAERPSDTDAAALRRLDAAVAANLRVVAARFDARDRVVAPIVDTGPLVDEIVRLADQQTLEGQTLDAAARLIDKLDRAVVRLVRDERTERLDARSVVPVGNSA